MSSCAVIDAIYKIHIVESGNDSETLKTNENN